MVTATVLLITIDLSVPAVPIRRAHFLLCPAGTCLLPPPKPVPRWTTPSAISDASQNKLKLFPNESSHKTEDSLQPRDSSEQKQGTQGTKSRSIQRLTEEQVWRGLSCGSDSKESACNAGDPGSIPGSRRPSGEGMAVHSSILAWRIHGQRNLAGYTTGLQRVGQDWATNTKHEEVANLPWHP